MAEDMVASLTLRLQNELSGGLDSIKTQFNALGGSLDALNATMAELRDIMAGIRGPIQMGADLKALQEQAAQTGLSVAGSMDEIGAAIDKDITQVDALKTALADISVPPIVPPVMPGGGQPKPGSDDDKSSGKPLGGGDMITDALAVAFGYDSFKSFATFDQAAKQISIVEGLHGQAATAETARLKDMANSLALKFANDSTDLMDAYSFLVTDSIPKAEVDRLMPSLAEASTAYNVPVSEMSQAVFTLYKNLGITPDQMGTGLSVLHHAAMQGHFGMEDFGMYLPEIGGQMSLMGMDGVQGEITGASALEVLRKNTGTSGEAATDLQDLLFYLHSPMGLRVFDKSTRMVDLLGPSGKALLEKYHVPSLDLPQYLNTERAAGIDPINALADYFTTILKDVKSPTDRADIVGSFMHNQAAQNAILSLLQYNQDFKNLQTSLAGVDDKTVREDFFTAVSGTSADLKLFDENLSQASRDIGGVFDSMVAEPFSHIFSPNAFIPGGYGPTIPGLTQPPPGMAPTPPNPAPVIHLHVNVDKAGVVTVRSGGGNTPSRGPVLGRH